MIVKSSAEAIDRAAEALSKGLLVGMPTETVYGIAANALDQRAVRATFTLKGRPLDNPLIVHLGAVEDLASVASEVPSSAWLLAERFWPGPLTLVLPKRTEISNEVTAGLATVAVRVPSHPVALALLKAAHLPISAPSANTFMGLSPTRAQDISSEIEAGLAITLDGGPCSVGIESTVLDLSGSEPAILRPGLISQRQLAEALGVPVVTSDQRKAPGMYPKHYSPRTPVRLAAHLEPNDAGLTFLASTSENQIHMSGNPAEYAAKLFGALAELDKRNLTEIVVEIPPQTDEWVAVNDRLAKASRSRL